MCVYCVLLQGNLTLLKENIKYIYLRIKSIEDFTHFQILFLLQGEDF